MATDGAIGRRLAAAVGRIETALSKQSGGQSLNLPKQSRFGDKMLVVLQVEAIADFLDSMPIARTQPESDRDLPTLQELRNKMDGKQSIDNAETEEGSETPDYQSMTNAKLEELIKDRGLEKGKAHTKPELIAVLEAADKDTEDA